MSAWATNYHRIKLEKRKIRTINKVERTINKVDIKAK